MATSDKKKHYFLNIGSNLGPRKLNISRALRAIEETFGYFEASHIVESQPQGYDSDNPYLNIGVMILSEREPEDVLDALQDMERRLGTTPHRDSTGGYADRDLDIDIVAIDELVIDTPRLSVPHPRLAERTFFLEPLAELAPLWRHPRTGQTASEMLPPRIR